MLIAFFDENSATRPGMTSYSQSIINFDQYSSNFSTSSQVPELMTFFIVIDMIEM